MLPVPCDGGNTWRNCMPAQSLAQAHLWGSSNITERIHARLTVFLRHRHVVDKVLRFVSRPTDRVRILTSFVRLVVAVRQAYPPPTA